MIAPTRVLKLPEKRYCKGIRIINSGEEVGLKTYSRRQEAKTGRLVFFLKACSKGFYPRFSTF